MELPPVIQIAIEEELWKFDSPRRLEESLKSHGLLRELSTQAKWSVDEFHFADDSLPRLDQFIITPSDTLNPFSPIGKCAAEACHAEATDDFIKLVGLYSDSAIIPDPVTNFFVSDRLNYSDYPALVTNLQTLGRLFPLIEAGILRFADPIHRLCSHCHERVQTVVKRATDALLLESTDYKVELSGSRKRPLLFITSPDLQSVHSHPLMTVFPLNRTQLTLIGSIDESGQPRSERGKQLVQKLIARRIKKDVTSVFFDLRTSQKSHSLFLAGTRPEALVINQIDQIGPKLGQIEDWEALRTVRLPWISELSAREVVSMREEAATALPRLRELLRQRLVDPSVKTAQIINETVMELRTQALEVQSELSALGLPRENYYRLGMGGIAISFVVYALATQSPAVVATSVGALLGTLAHLRKTEREQADKQTNLASMPAYALLKAKEILGKRDAA